MEEEDELYFFMLDEFGDPGDRMTEDDNVKKPSKTKTKSSSKSRSGDKKGKKSTAVKRQHRDADDDIDDLYIDETHDDGEDAVPRREMEQVAFDADGSADQSKDAQNGG